MTGEEISSGDVTSNLTLKSRIQVGPGYYSPAVARERGGSLLPGVDFDWFLYNL